jgi:NAD(P)-dependent dehydrogenase (short-subunit alcohol dehydrogenase family)
MNSGLGFSPYSASKFAVVNMSEGLAKQLAPLGIGVTMLCPGFVRTRIWESGRNLQTGTPDGIGRFNHFHNIQSGGEGSI